MASSMDRQRISHALQRIARATDRIEATAGTRSGDPQLEQRHAALRAEASAALADLDRLIGQLDG
jgi:hypothetical protein